KLLILTHGKSVLRFAGRRRTPSTAVWTGMVWEPQPTKIPVRVLKTFVARLGPAAGARLPARSDAEPASMAMPSVPAPLMALMVTVRLAPVLLSKLKVPAAVPV